LPTLIPFPIRGYNTYVTLSDAQSIAQNYLFGQSFLALTEEQQSLYILQAFRVIQNLNGFTEPDIGEDITCLATAQVEIALQDNQYQISFRDPKTQQVKREKAGAVEMEYYELPVWVDVDLIPQTARTCLESYGATVSTPCVMGSVRKVR